MTDHHDAAAQPTENSSTSATNTGRARRGLFVTGARVGARVGAGAAFGAWIADFVTLAASRGHVTPSSWWTGIGAALFVAWTAAVVVGGVAGAILAPTAASVVDTLRRWWKLLRADPAEVVALAIGMPVVFAAWSWLGYRAVVGIQLSLARPESIAAAMTVFAWVFACSLVLAWPLCHRASRVAAVRLTRLGPRLAWAKYVVPFAAAGAAVIWASEVPSSYRQAVLEGAAHDAPRVLAGAAGAAVALLWTRAWTRARRPWLLRVRRCVGIAAFAAALGSVVAAAHLRPEATSALAVGFGRAVSGNIGHAVWTAALDFDRDGQLNVLGGGDCAPFDPHRYTGAVDVPGNGVDEDCDGSDAQPIPIRPRPRIDVGQGRLPRRPTIVFVTVDGLGAPRLSALGSPRPIMPHLDELAARSMLFAHCFAQGPSTRLSFPAMFTSRYDSELPFEPGPTHPYSFAPSVRQLQEVLDDAGYETVAVIPNAYFDHARWASITRGFQRVDRSAVPNGIHNAPQVTDAALRVLSEERNRPLYLWLHYYDAHAPYVRIASEQYADDTDQSLYEGELHYIDRELARIIAAVDQRAEPTYLFVTADHSTVFHPEPSTRRAHYGFDLYTATLHVPLVVHGPGIRTGRDEALVSTMDVAPTIVDLIGVQVPSFEGTSLTPELLAGRSDPQRTIFHEFYLPERLFHGYEPLEMVSLHSGRYNLVLNRVSGTYELYDYVEDYFERRDLYEDDAHLPAVAHLRSLLAAFLSHSDPADHGLIAQGAEHAFGPMSH